MFNFDAYHEKITEDYMIEQQEISDMACELLELRRNWASLRDLLQSTVDRHSDDDDIDTTVAEEVIDEMDRRTTAEATNETFKRMT